MCVSFNEHNVSHKEIKCNHKKRNLHQMYEKGLKNA
nr:MAG TPA_asm: hypothetical protein [Caudoviricetes sp.]